MLRAQVAPPTIGPAQTKHPYIYLYTYMHTYIHASSTPTYIYMHTCIPYIHNYIYTHLLGMYVGDAFALFAPQHTYLSSF